MAQAQNNPPSPQNGPTSTSNIPRMFPPGCEWKPWIGEVSVLPPHTLGCDGTPPTSGCHGCHTRTTARSSAESRRQVLMDELTEMAQVRVNLLQQRLMGSVDESLINAKLQLCTEIYECIDDYLDLVISGKPYSAVKRICDMPVEAFCEKFGDHLGTIRILRWAHLWLSQYICRVIYGDLGHRIPPVDPALYRMGLYLG